MNRRHFVSTAAAFALGTRAASAAGGSTFTTNGPVNAPTSPPNSPQFATSLRDKLQTRAELSTYAETSSNADVQRFLLTLDLRGAPVARGLLGVSAKGRNIPYVVCSRPLLLDGASARAVKKPVVMIVTGSHANEPDGKEAVLAVLRDLSLSTDHTILEDMVLVIVPNLNVDGNAAMAAASVNGPTLNGPVRVGAAPDGAGVDLENDFLACRSNAVSQLVDLIKYWDPDVFVDLRTQTLSYASYSLTYAPSLHPAAFYGGAYARDTMLPVLRKNLKDKFGMTTFVAGGFGKRGFLGYPTPGTELGWYAPDDDAGIATNYLGIRGTTAVAAFANPHDTFERRVFYLRAFLEVTLQYCSDESDALLSRTRLASHWVTGAIPIRTARDPKASSKEPIAWEQPAIDQHTHDHQLGMPTGLTLDNKFLTSITPVFDRYVGSAFVQQPAGYVLDASRAPLARQLLAKHGVTFEVLTAAKTFAGQTFVPARVDRSTRLDGTAFTAARGSWTSGSYVMPAGSLFVVSQQAQGPLLSLLLEPECESGLVTLRAFEATLAVGAPHVVHRAFAPA